MVWSRLGRTGIVVSAFTAGVLALAACSSTASSPSSAAGSSSTAAGGAGTSTPATGPGTTGSSAVGATGPSAAVHSSPAPSAAHSSISGTGSAAKPGPAVPLVVYSAQGYDTCRHEGVHGGDRDPGQARRRQHRAVADQGRGGKEQPAVGSAVGRRRHRVRLAGQAGPVAAVHTPHRSEHGRPGAHCRPIIRYIPISTTVMAAVIYNAAKATSVPSTYQDLLGLSLHRQGRDERPVAVRPDLSVHRRPDEPARRPVRRVAAGESYLPSSRPTVCMSLPTNGDTLHALETGQINYGLIQSSAATG